MNYTPRNTLREKPQMTCNNCPWYTTDLMNPTSGKKFCSSASGCFYKNSREGDKDNELQA